MLVMVEKILQSFERCTSPTGGVLNLAVEEDPVCVRLVT
jgi:hypothetical protein